MSGPKSFGGALSIIASVIAISVKPENGNEFGTARLPNSSRTITHAAQMQELSKYDTADYGDMIQMVKGMYFLAHATDTLKVGRKFPTRLDLPPSASVKGEVFVPELLATDIVRDDATFEKLCDFLQETPIKDPTGARLNTGPIIVQLREFRSGLANCLGHSTERG